MLDVLIVNGTVVRQNNQAEIKNVNIGISDGVIEYLGNEIIKAKKIIDANEYIILPAFINSHIHFGEYFLRGYPKKISTEEYINMGERFHKKFKNINDEIRSSSIDNVMLESVQNGTLTVCGVRGWPNVQKFPVTAFLGYPLMKSSKLKEYNLEFQKKIFELKKESNVQYFVGLHSIKWIDETTLKNLTEFMQENENIKLSLHICETKEEIKYIENKYKMTPIELLLKYKLLSKRTLLVHCNYLSERDKDIIKEKEATVVICHNSNLKLGNIPADIESLVKKGINVVIGTDEPATNDSLSLLESLKTTALLTKLDVNQLLDMITINPAKYMGINAGKIEKGAKADLLLYNENSLNCTYKQSIIQNLIFTSNNKPEIIIQNGEIIMENFKLTNNIEQTIINKKNEIVKKIEGKWNF